MFLIYNTILAFREKRERETEREREKCSILLGCKWQLRIKSSENVLEINIKNLNGRML